MRDIKKNDITDREIIVYVINHIVNVVLVLSLLLNPDEKSEKKIVKTAIIREGRTINGFL